jgi:CRISPR-associated helicase Cas3
MLRATTLCQSRYVRSPTDAQRVARELGKRASPGQVTMLTGTMRGHERDELVANPVFKRFLASQASRDMPIPTVYLVSTSAGEVGVDLDADAGLLDLVPLDAMVQRLGRVNRTGAFGPDQAVRDACFSVRGVQGRHRLPIDRPAQNGERCA